MRERLTGNGGFVKGGDAFDPPPEGTPAPTAPAALCGPPPAHVEVTVQRADGTVDIYRVRRVNE